jgi:ankyrin repeat protein
MNSFQAAFRGRVDRLRTLVSVANVNSTNSHLRTALHLASQSGNGECAKLLIQCGANVHARDMYGWTALHYATKIGCVDVARDLIEAGAMVDATNNNGETALHWAILETHHNCALLLIERGARVSNVKLDKFLPCVPSWVQELIESRCLCRSAAIALIGIHKYHCTTVTGPNDNNVIREVAKYIWATRLEHAWAAEIEAKRLKSELDSKEDE